MYTVYPVEILLSDKSDAAAVCLNTQPKAWRRRREKKGKKKGHEQTFYVRRTSTSFADFPFFFPPKRRTNRLTFYQLSPNKAGKEKQQPFKALKKIAPTCFGFKAQQVVGKSCQMSFETPVKKHLKASVKGIGYEAIRKPFQTADGSSRSPHFSARKEEVSLCLRVPLTSLAVLPAPTGLSSLGMSVGSYCFLFFLSA